MAKKIEGISFHFSVKTLSKNPSFSKMFSDVEFTGLYDKLTDL